MSARRWLALALGAAGCLAGAQPPAGEGEVRSTGVPVTRLSFAEHTVELSGPDGAWSPLAEGGRLRTGDHLRTGPEGVARLEFPWMGLTVGPESEVAIPAGVVLSTELVKGRVEVGSERGEIIKLTAGDVEVRGEGRAVVRREGGTSWVIALSGSFRVRAEGRTIDVEAGQGTRALAGQAPGPAEPLPQVPSDLQPGSDPTYFKPGEPVQLTWTGSARKYHLQVLGVDSEVVLINRDVAGPPYSLAFPWAGTFRWRVSAQDERGFESLPSGEGLVCLLQK